jgi:hypothetical protein
MPKTLVGRVKNDKFAFFWLLMGGSLGNILFSAYSPQLAITIFLPPAILSVLIAVAIAGKTHRPKIWLGIDLIVTFITLLLIESLSGSYAVRMAISIPNLLITLGCILGIMDW